MWRPREKTTSVLIRLACPLLAPSSQGMGLQSRVREKLVPTPEHTSLRAGYSSVQEVKLSGVRGHDSREANSKAEDVFEAKRTNRAAAWRGYRKTQPLRRKFPVTVTFVLAMSTHRPASAQTNCRACVMCVFNRSCERVCKQLANHGGVVNRCLLKSSVSMT